MLPGVWIIKLSASDAWCELDGRRKVWQPVDRSVDAGGSDSGKAPVARDDGCRHNLVTPRPGPLRPRDKRSFLTPYPSTTVNRTLRHRFIRKCPFKRNSTALSPSCRVCLRKALFNRRKLSSSTCVFGILLPPAKTSDPIACPQPVLQVLQAG